MNPDAPTSPGPSLPAVTGSAVPGGGASAGSTHAARRPLLLGLVGLCALGVLSGCSSAGDDPASAAGRSTGGSGTLPSLTTGPSPTATSDVIGRHFDVGTVTGTAVVGGVLTLKLDRWTVKGMSDAKLAKDGIAIRPHDDNLFTNQNDERTRTVPVAPDAQLVVNTCVVSGTDAARTLGMTSTPQAATSWLQNPDPKAVLLLRYDAAGRVTRLDTDPRC